MAEAGGARDASHASPEREERFTGLFREHHAAVRRYARRRDPDLADDLVAETFALAWRELERVPADNPLPWLLAVARNLRLNLIRGEQRRRRREDRASDAYPARLVSPGFATEIAERSHLLSALARLPEIDREVLLLAAWDHLDRAEIAIVLGCSRPAVAVRLHRARRRLEAALRETGAGPNPSCDSLEEPG